MRSTRLLLGGYAITMQGVADFDRRDTYRYADVFSFDAQGHPVADLSAVSRMERDAGAEPVLSGWEDPHWNEGEPEAD